jgi:hypothetical protein
MTVPASRQRCRNWSEPFFCRILAHKEFVLSLVFTQMDNLQTKRYLLRSINSNKQLDIYIYTYITYNIYIYLYCRNCDRKVTRLFPHSECCPTSTENVQRFVPIKRLKITVANFPEWHMFHLVKQTRTRTWHFQTGRSHLRNKISAEA